MNPHKSKHVWNGSTLSPVPGSATPPSLMFHRVASGWAPLAEVHGGRGAFPAWPASRPSQNDPFLLHSFGTSFCQRNTDGERKIRAGFRWGKKSSECQCVHPEET